MTHERTTKAERAAAVSHAGRFASPLFMRRLIADIEERDAVLRELVDICCNTTLERPDAGDEDAWLRATERASALIEDKP